MRELRPDVVFVTSPNNPTGTAVALETIRAIYDATSYDDGAGVVVVDEAYAEFARAGTPSALTLLPGRPRLIVSRTMSKAFGMAGLRLGYLAADAAVVDALQLVRLPYHLQLADPGRRAAPRWRTPTRCWPRSTRSRRSATGSSPRCPALGLTSVPSDANFVLFGRFADAARRLAGAARPRRPGPRRRPARLAAGDRGDGGGDGRVPHRVGGDRAGPPRRSGRLTA